MLFGCLIIKKYKKETDGNADHTSGNLVLLRIEWNINKHLNVDKIVGASQSGLNKGVVA